MDSGEKGNRFVVSLEVQALVKRLIRCEVGEVVGYDELAGLANGDVTGSKEGYGRLYSARRILMRDEGMVFSAITGKGIQRLSDSEIVRGSVGFVRKIRSGAKRSARVLSCVDFDGLSSEDKVEHQRHMSILMAVGHLTKPATIKRVGGMVDPDVPRWIPTREMFDRLK